jgi:glycosyltransferase involved in cell wall biosynthesis
MNVAFVTPQDTAGLAAWSGIPHYMLRALRGAGLAVTTIDNLRPGGRLRARLKTVAYARLRGQTYRPDRDPATLRAYARQVDAALSAAARHGAAPDAILSTGTRPLAYLPPGAPAAIWTDATFAGMVDFYPSFSRLARETLRDGHRAERAALARCSLAIFASDWAARTAVEAYDVPAERVRVVPFGANLDETPSPEAVADIIRGRSREKLRLLFVGVDWFRKGGDVAAAVVEQLNRGGQRAELDVVGCVPPRPLPQWARVHGFVAKHEEAGRRLLDQLYRDCHFLILPSRAECWGIVIGEAGAYGMPVVAADVGGIPSAVREGENGRTFPPEAGADAYATYLAETFASAAGYEALATAAHRHYLARLNWPVAAARVAELLRDLVA